MLITLSQIADLSIYGEWLYVLYVYADMSMYLYVYKYCIASAY